MAGVAGGCRTDTVRDIHFNTVYSALRVSVNEATDDVYAISIAHDKIQRFSQGEEQRTPCAGMRQPATRDRWMEKTRHLNNFLVVVVT